MGRVGDKYIDRDGFEYGSHMITCYNCDYFLVHGSKNPPKKYHRCEKHRHEDSDFDRRAHDYTNCPDYRHES